MAKKKKRPPVVIDWSAVDPSRIAVIPAGKTGSKTLAKWTPKFARGKGSPVVQGGRTESNRRRH
jgi:hypothetical protein